MRISCYTHCHYSCLKDLNQLLLIEGFIEVDLNNFWYVKVLCTCSLHRISKENYLGVLYFLF